jgi:hypothetical protein
MRLEPRIAGGDWAISSSGRSKWKSVTSTLCHFSGADDGNLHGKLRQICGGLHGCFLLLKLRQIFELFFGLGKTDGEVERGLNGDLVGGNLASPGNGDAGKWFGDEKAVPGAGLPGALRVDVEGAHGGVGQFGELDDSDLGDHGGAAGAVGGDGAVVAVKVDTVEIAQADGAVAGAGAADSDEAEALDGTGDEFAVEAAADEDGDAVVAEAPGAGEQAAMPEGIDGRRWCVVTGNGARFADVSVTECDPKTADGHARDAGDDGKGEPLFQRVG